jgi:hypothetical protein
MCLHPADGKYIIEDLEKYDKAIKYAENEFGKRKKV